MIETELDGVPVFWQQGPEPLTAGVLFGVGRRDETFVGGGITHLVEHLAMAALGRTALDCNANVDLVVTEFFASGRPDRVVDFVNRVCAALADLPVDRLAVEADVLRAEEGFVCRPELGRILTERYGARGSGLAGLDEPALRSITAGQVREWTARWFHRGNAAVWFTGPVPEGLRLALPDGPPRPPAPPLVRQARTPGWLEYRYGDVALTFEVPRTSPAARIATWVLHTRIEDELRHARGLVYDVAPDAVPADDDTHVWGVFAAVPPPRAAATVRTMWELAESLATHGPEPAELAHEVDVATEEMADPRSTSAQLSLRATAHVLGTPWRPFAERADELRTVTADEVRDAAAAMLATAVAGVPEGGTVDLAGFTPEPAASPHVVTGREYRRRFRSAAPRGARLLLGDDGVAVEFPDARRWAVRWRDAIGLVDEGDGVWSLVGADGFSVPLSAADWRDGEQVIAAVRAAVPPELQVLADPHDA